MSMKHDILTNSIIVGVVRTTHYTNKFLWVSSPYITRDIKVQSNGRDVNGNIVLVRLGDEARWEDAITKGKNMDHDGFSKCATEARRLAGGDVPIKDVGGKLPFGFVIRTLVHSHPVLLGRLFVPSEAPVLSPEAEHMWRIPKTAIDDILKKPFQLIKPNDVRYPPVGVVFTPAQKQLLLTNYVTVEMSDWPMAQKYPSGNFVRTEGSLTDLKYEHSIIMSQNGFDASVLPDELVEVRESPEAFLASGAPEGTGYVPGAPAYLHPDGVIRHDVRELDAMISIDPETAKDLDDALSVRKLSGNRYLIGVHIADVSHFVRPDTTLDRFAAKRQTSVYLVGECIPMLPKFLSEHMCSLNPGETKFTFTCYWVVDYDKSILEKKLQVVEGPYFAKTINRSICRLSYQQAFQIMENNEVESTWTGLVTGTDPQRVRDALQVLRALHRCIRASRPGWIELARDGGDIKFNVDPAGKIVGVSPYALNEANKMIETWMVEANRAAGLLQNPATAVLRNHEGFNPTKTKIIEACLRELGIAVSFKSKLAFINSLERLSDDVRLKVMTVCTYALKPAKYLLRPEADDFEMEDEDQAQLAEMMKGLPASDVDRVKTSLLQCKADVELHHFGLDIEIYTHFTSPIRRYPDILVHRNLTEHCKLVQEEVVATCEQRSDIEDLMLHANTQHVQSEKAQKQSELLHLNLYLKSLPAPVPCVGTVVNVNSRQGTVFLQISLDAVPLIVEDVVLFTDEDSKQKQFNVVSVEFDRTRMHGSIRWKSGAVTTFHLLSQFDVALVYSDASPPSSKIVLLSSH